jgi:hypothetical protein
MADTGRKDFHDSEFPITNYRYFVVSLTVGAELGDKITPDSSKSTTDKIGDSLTGAGDKIQRFVSSPPPLTSCSVLTSLQ